MICVYPADCTDFSTNGNGTLAPLSAEVTETLNGEYELTLVHPMISRKRKAGFDKKSVICPPFQKAILNVIPSSTHSGIEATTC